MSNKFGLIDVRSLSEWEHVEQWRKCGLNGHHAIGSLMIVLILAGCGSMQRWSQNELKSASVAHKEATHYAKHGG